MVQHALAGAAALTGMGQRTWHRLWVCGREAELDTSTTPSRGLSHCSTRLDRQAPPCACRRISHGWAHPATLPCYSARACSRKPPREPPGVELRRGSHDPGRRGGSCRVTQDTASRTAAPSPCQSNKHFDFLLRVFLSPHMAPTQAAVEEDDEEEERTPQVCRRRSWASPSPRREGDSRQALVAATVGGHKSGAGVLEYLIGRGRSRPGTSRQGGDLHHGQHDASGRPGARCSGGLGLGCLVADKGI